MALKPALIKSLMASVHRRHRFYRSLADGGIKERLVFGMDFPIPNRGWAFPLKFMRAEKSPLRLPRNYFDRDVSIKESCGVDDKIYSRGYQAAVQDVIA